MISKEVEFLTKDGLKLKGTLRLPDGKVLGAAVIIAGSGPTDRNGNSTAIDSEPFNKINLYRDVADFCADNGMAVFSFDKRSCPVYQDQWTAFMQKKEVGSDPQLADLFSFEKTVADAREAVFSLVAESGLSEIPLTIIGHSEGGLVALKIASEQKVDNLILLATAGRTLREVLRDQIFENVKKQAGDETVAKQFLDHANNAMDALSQDKPLPGNLPQSLSPLFNETTRKYFKQILDLDPLSLAQKTSANVLIVNGTNDVQIHHQKDAEALYEAFAKRGQSPNPHKLTKIKEASHCFKKTDNPDDVQKAFGGPVSPELFQALKDFLEHSAKPRNLKNKKSGPKL